MGRSKYIVEEGSCTVVLLLRVDGTCEGAPFGGNLYSGWEVTADEKKEWTWNVDFAGGREDDDEATGDEEGDACQYLGPSGHTGNSGASLVHGAWREV